MIPTFLTQHDSLNYLERYLPTINLLISESSNYTKNIIRSYERKYNQIKNEIELKGEFKGQSTIFDILFEAAEGIPSKKEFLLFIDNVVFHILLNIDKCNRSQVRKICYRMISNFSTEESQYKRFLSELCVLENIVTNKKFILVQIEKKLENGRTFDFHFRSNNKDTYVEVYNIDFNVERIKSEECFHKWLTSKLELKINSKIQGITIEKVDFIFVPVLWGNIKQLAKYKNVFESFKEYKFLSPFMMISEKVSPINEYVYAFEPVITFLGTNKEIDDRNRPR